MQVLRGAAAGVMSRTQAVLWGVAGAPLLAPLLTLAGSSGEMVLCAGSLEGACVLGYDVCSMLACFSGGRTCMRMPQSSMCMGHCMQT